MSCLSGTSRSCCSALMPLEAAAGVESPGGPWPLRLRFPCSSSRASPAPGCCSSCVETGGDASDSAGPPWRGGCSQALIWCFSLDSRTTSRLMLFYHLYMLLDIWVLCGLWFWGISSNLLHLDISALNIAVFAGSPPVFYLIGLFWKGIYFYGLHPDVEEDEKEEEKERLFTHVQPDKWTCVKKQEQIIAMKIFYLFYLLPGFSKCFKNLEPGSSEPTLSNRRMEDLAKSFYMKPAPQQDSC